MSKRIVVGLDGSPYAKSALNLAIRRARIYNSTLIGVTVIDRPSIEHLSVGAQPGALQISEETVSTMLNDAKRHSEDLIAQFRMTCDLADIKHDLHGNTV